MGNSPKIFISYSHDSQDHKDWVKKLATNLREYMGIDVILDQWDLRLGSDLSLFMEQGLNSSNLVLCVCSDKYVEKVNAGKGGSGYEKMIMVPQLLSDTSIEHIIPIKRNNLNNCMPAFLSTKLYIDFNNDECYLKNLSKITYRIYNQDNAQKPALGRNPFAINNFSDLDMKIILEKTKFQNHEMSGNEKFNFLNNSGKFIIGSGEYQFTTKWSKCGTNSIYAYSDDVKYIGYLSGFNKMPETEILCTFDYTSRARQVYLGEIIVWVNSNNNVAVTKILNIINKSRDGSENLLEFEYIIFD
ncbi:MAG: toll/interleukin-1 receptor domain-containing protein [Mycoplasmatota bacterium]